MDMIEPFIGLVTSMRNRNALNTTLDYKNRKKVFCCTYRMLDRFVLYWVKVVFLGMGYVKQTTSHKISLWMWCIYFHWKQIIWDILESDWLFFLAEFGEILRKMASIDLLQGEGGIHHKNIFFYLRYFADGLLELNWSITII